jgi:phosphoenolpyruvate synthase/pyruvate phosphate dikinase
VALLELTDGAPAAQVGGKGAGLARLAGLGLPVPPALALAPAAHARARARGGIAIVDRELLRVALERLGAPLAVRSSAVDEDGAERSAAGQYESVMGVVDLDGLIAAVERCYASAASERVAAYRGRGEPELAVVLQREVPAQRAGVAFTIDPVSGDESHVLVEMVFGHGEALVGGGLAPDRYLVPRHGGAVRVRVADKPAALDGRGGIHALPDDRRLARTLRDDEARAVAQLALAAEAGLGTPVDVEVCFEGRTLWAVQCRPVTAHG